MNNCKNRQRAAVAAAGVLGILLLAAPEAAAEGFASGTALCLASVLPALFPFFVVCELLTAAPPPARLLRPLQRLLGLEAPEAAQAVALSWLGGYAVSAQLAGRLYGAHRISRRDARRLLLLGCCSGPGFVIGCVGGLLLGRLQLGVLLYTAQLAANLAATACLDLFSASGRPSRAFSAARPALPARRRRLGLPLRHLRGRQCKPVCLWVRGVFPHRGRGHPIVFTGAAPAAQCCTGDQRWLRGRCRAGRADSALRLLRCFESARPFSLVPDTAFFRGCVLPACPSGQPGTALFLFAGVDPALRALFAGQSGCLQQPFGKGRTNFPAAARCGAAGIFLSVCSTLQGSTKPL